MSSEGEGPAAARYNQLTSERQPFLQEAYLSSQLSIPWLFPTTSDIITMPRYAGTELKKPWQTVGAVEHVERLVEKPGYVATNSHGCPQAPVGSDHGLVAAPHPRPPAPDPTEVILQS